MRSPQQDFRHAAICFCIAGPVWYYEGSSGDAGWSSPVARWAHNPKVAGSNPAPATNLRYCQLSISHCQFGRSFSDDQSAIENWQSAMNRGCSSVGRAPRLQRGGQGFESPHLHQCVGDLRLKIADWREPKLEPLLTLATMCRKLNSFAD